MKHSKITTSALSLLSCLTACDPSVVEQAVHDEAQSLSGGPHDHNAHAWRRRIEHVLLLSVDGLHQKDLARFLSDHPDSTLAALSEHAVQYRQAHVNDLDGGPTNPSDSFPGLLALTTGGSSPTTGGWYDVSYARDLFAYQASSPCGGASGTMVTYDEGIELDNSGLWGSADATPTHDPAVVRSRLDPTKLPYEKTRNGCTPVYPHQYLRVNTIFEVAHAAGKHTAWSDKHLAYELVTGPSGAGLDDFFAPEINSDAHSLIADASAGADFTTSYAYTKVYDDYKAAAILREIAGQWSDTGLPGATDTAGTPGVPAIFGMNFQAVSVAQKSARTGGGYADADATPNAQVEDALVHTDATLGSFVAALAAHGLSDSTLIIVTAKHGQSPIDPKSVTRVDGDAVVTQLETVAPVAGHIEDDVALYWLSDSKQSAAAAAQLAAAPTTDRVFTAASPDFARMFGDPRRDPRTPDVVVQPKVGVIYSLSTKKQAEHGGFADDDSHVALLVAHPAFAAVTVDEKVRTKQVAPTVLEALGLAASRLEAVRKEHTRVLPGLGL